MNSKARGCPVRLIDITGRRFGSLVAKRYYGGTKWLCQCDCGETILVCSSPLRSGAQKTCGKHSRGKHKDITGIRFGMLVVVAKTDRRTRKKEVLWECLCDCGQMILCRASKLRRGESKSCGCLSEQRDLTGMEFGRLRVLGKGSDGRWLCRCSCGKLHKSTSKNLLGGTKSCGCLRIECAIKCGESCLVDLSGKKFGAWTVVGRAVQAQTKHGDTLWECLCGCGARRVITGGSLSRGDTKSCGCAKIKNEYYDINRTIIPKHDSNLYDKAVFKKCICCGNIKRMKDYYKHGPTGGGKHTICIDCYLISDNHMKSSVRGIENGRVTETILELKREQLLINRTIVSIKKGVKNGCIRASL